MSRMSGSVRSRYFIDRIRFGVEKTYFCFFGFRKGVKSIPWGGDSLFRLRTGGRQILGVARNPKKQKYVFLTPNRILSMKYRERTLSDIRDMIRTCQKHVLDHLNTILGWFLKIFFPVFLVFGEGGRQMRGQTIAVTTPPRF